MRTRRSLSNESGVALVTAMLVILLMSALMVGMFASLTTDTRSHAADRDQTQAYAAAQAGLEKLTSGLAQLFSVDASPSVAQINAIAATPPVIPTFTFTSPGGSNGSGYAVTWTADAQGNPQAIATSITTGPYTGFQGLITKYTATITAASKAGAEVRLRREIQTVAVPVFQFGVFSESDLTFYAGDAFNFGGRVHTNGSLFACEFGPSLTFADRITAVGEAVHNTLSNTLLASTVGCTGTTNIATSPSTSRNWQMTEGSVTGMPGTPANPNWGTISNGTYRNYIRTGATGAKRLDLPLVSQGATPIDLIRRPRINSAENLANPQVFGQRFYSQASLRILLSDRVNDIMSLPGVSVTAPVSLDWDAGLPAGYNPAGGGVVDATHPPLARSVGPASFQTNNNSTFAGGIAQIYYNVGAISVVTPAAPVPVWKIPLTVTVTKGAVNTVVTCNGKTGVNAIAAGGVYPAYRANSLISCNNAVAINTPATVTATVNGVTFTKTVTRNIAANGDIEMAAPGGISDTAQFSQNLLWINSSPGATVPGTAIPVTCQGYIDTLANPHFFNCIGNGMTTAPDSVWVYTSARVNQNTNMIGGFIKIERQNNAGVWTDVTMEILNLGIGGRNASGVLCADPTPTAIIRIQRLADNGGGSCPIGETRNPWEWWPNTLYDTREGSFRDTATTAPMNLGGVMQYISLDVNNLKLWLSGALAGTGNLAVNNNGYIVYFSDRRGNHDQNNADVETGEYGFEDQVNPTVAGCCSLVTPPNGGLDPGEDMNAQTGVAPTQELYGRTPHPLVVPPAAGPLSPYDLAGRPWTPILIGNVLAGPGEGMARVSKVVLFRRALKLINGGINGGVNSLPAAGLTVASENPVYVQGNYNATTIATAEPNVPAAIMADAITLLSNNWNDALSFEVPTLATARNATTTGYRFAAVAGKGVSFPYCAGNCANPAGAPTANPGFLYGTDGGVGNFLRLLEDWNVAGITINYRGSLISLFTSRQAIGTFKFNTNVYDFGTRVFTFDDDFLTPSLLPPGTPMFRDVNTLKFRQILRPNQ